MVVKGISFINICFGIFVFTVLMLEIGLFFCTGHLSFLGGHLLS